MARRPTGRESGEAYAGLHEKTLAQSCLTAPQAAVEQAQLRVQEPLTLAVHQSLAPLEFLWTTFQDRAHGTFYQTFLWCRAWAETVGQAQNIELRIVTAKDRSGRPVFILPLQIRRRFGMRVLEWMGTPQIAYGHGLFAPAFLPGAQDWFAANWAHIVKLAAPVDAIFLSDMPAALSGQLHPLQQLFNLRGPNRSYRMALSANYDQLLAQKRSPETRHVYRKKERGLAALGDLSFGLPETMEETHTALETMFDQQEKRLGERGVHGIFGPLERDFVHRLASLQDQPNAVLLPYQIKSRGEVLAMQLGGVYGGTFWAMISSLADTDLRKYSPGDLALRRSIQASCKQGLTCFDFAAGDTEYKLNWADDVVSLHVLLSAINLRGLLWVSLKAAGIFAKRVIKQSPVIRNAVMSIRRSLFGTRIRRPN